jgi:hypothetical protein
LVEVWEVVLVGVLVVVLEAGSVLMKEAALGGGSEAASEAGLVPVKEEGWEEVRELCCFNRKNIYRADHDGHQIQKFQCTHINPLSKQSDKE